MAEKNERTAEETSVTAWVPMAEKVVATAEAAGTVGAAGEARALAALWGALARGLLRPDAALVEQVRSGAFAVGLDGLLDRGADPALDRALGLLGEYGRDAAGRDAETVRLELEVEYNRLFVGPAKLVAPPYESYYASASPEGKGGRLRTADEFAVRHAYEAAGYAMPDAFVDLPDHIALELDFLALLVRDEAAAWEAGEAGRAEELRARADAFAAEHPARWVGRLATLVDAGARLGFYPALARIACMLLEA